MFHPEIYRAYDIRGVVPDEIDAEEYYHIGRAYAQYTGAKKVVVARDMRPSGDEFEPELIHGLTDGGVKVLRVGLATTPMFYYAVHVLKADGGVMVTASHNPAQYNGVKMTREQAIPIAGDTGLFAIRDLVAKRVWTEVVPGGSVENVDIKQAYIDMVTEGVKADGLKIVVDAGNGMTGYILADIFKKIGGEVIPLYWELDGSFPNHEADPLKPENMVALQQAVKKHQADLGIACDGDGDRVFFCTEEGKTIPGDITTAIIAREILKKYPGKPIVFDLRASRTTAEMITQAGGQPVMWHVGHSLIKPKMREVGAPFAGEVSGHFYFAPWYAESSMLAMGYILRLLQREKKPLSQIVAPLLKYAKTPELNFKVADKETILNKLKEKYGKADKFYDFDGVRFEYKDWWANVRPSNTEPLLRLIVEATNPQLLQEKREEIENIIKSV